MQIKDRERDLRPKAERWTKTPSVHAAVWILLPNKRLQPDCKKKMKGT